MLMMSSSAPRARLYVVVVVVGGNAFQRNHNNTATIPTTTTHLLLFLSWIVSWDRTATCILSPLDPSSPSSFVLVVVFQWNVFNLVYSRGSLQISRREFSLFCPQQKKKKKTKEQKEEHTTTKGPLSLSVCVCLCVSVLFYYSQSAVFSLSCSFLCRFRVKIWWDKFLCLGSQYNTLNKIQQMRVTPNEEAFFRRNSPLKQRQRYRAQTEVAKSSQIKSFWR